MGQQLHDSQALPSSVGPLEEVETGTAEKIVDSHRRVGGAANISFVIDALYSPLKPNGSHASLDASESASPAGVCAGQSEPCL
ncbi:hypothetical protein MHYP_G00033360 [Metynnis hypsauchen]